MAKKFNDNDSTENSEFLEGSYSSSTVSTDSIESGGTFFSPKKSKLRRNLIVSIIFVLILFGIFFVVVLLSRSINRNYSPGLICKPEAEIPMNYAISRKYEDLKLHPYYDENMPCGDGGNSIGTIFNGDSPSCSAVAVSKKLVITARHCVEDKDFSLKFGCDNLNCAQTFNNDSFQLIYSDNLKYDNIIKMHDIAFIKVPKDIEFDKFKPACLPVNDSKTFEKMFLASFNEKRNVVKFNMTKVDNEECREHHTSDLFEDCSHLAPITEYHMCALIKYNNGELKGVDRGQSGSPLFTTVKSKNVLTGIVSWGGSEDKPHKPTVFLLIKPYIEEIWKQFE